MARKKGTLKVDQKFTCPNSSCGLVFSKPLKVKNLCVENSKLYHACPRCLTAVGIEESPQIFEAKPSVSVDVTEDVEITPRLEEKKAEPPTKTKCAHHFGYLSERPKNKTISEECVICENIVKCMLKAVSG